MADKYFFPVGDCFLSGRTFFRDAEHDRHVIDHFYDIIAYFADCQGGLPLAEHFDFCFGKTEEFVKRRVIEHGIFPKHIQCGAGAIFFDRQDTGHIGERHVGLIL